MYKTRKEFNEHHKKELDIKFMEKYPYGQFVAQILHHTYPQEYTEYGLYRKFKRDTSQTKNPCIGFSFSNYCGIQTKKYQDNAWGIVVLFNNIDKLIQYAKKRGFPYVIISRFKEKEK